MIDAQYKAIVALSIEVTLMRRGGPEYNQFLLQLERDYSCKISNCFENPYALKKTLIDVYGKSNYHKIVDEIELELNGYDSKYLVDFLNKLRLD